MFGNYPGIAVLQGGEDVKESIGYFNVRQEQC